MRLSFLLAATALLGACTPVTHNATIENYPLGQTSAFAAGSSLQLDLRGNPFGAEASDSLASAVATALEDGSQGPDFAVAPRQGDEPVATTRVVVALNAGSGARSLCQTAPDGAVTQGAGGQAVEVAAAVCRGDKTLSAVVGHAAKITGPDDPAFHKLMTQIAAEIFPSDNKIRSDQDLRNDNDFWIMSPF